MDPIYKCPAWFFTRHQDCVNVLKDKRILKSLQADQPHSSCPMSSSADIHGSLLYTDPPDHTRLRAIVHQAFTKEAVSALAPKIEEIAESLLTDMAGSSEVDLIESFTYLLPLTVICELLGLPKEDRRRIRVWTQSLGHIDVEADLEQSAREFSDYMDDIIQQRRQSPKEDILSGLILANEDDSQLSDAELMHMVFFLLISGHETLTHLLSNGIATLSQHPDQFAMLKNDPELISGAVEELLRYEGPFDCSSYRYAPEDMELNGVQIRKGELIYALVLAANRDPEVFDDPDRFDITRSPNPHISFGGGIHFCLGTHLARLEANIGLRALITYFPDIRLAVKPEKLEWLPSIMIHGVKRLPVKLNQPGLLKRCLQ